MLLDIAKRALAIPSVFDLYQRMVGAPNMLRRFVDEQIRPAQGDRLLDIGCGTGAMAPYLPHGVHLLGIDISESYIRAATDRYGLRGEFRVADASDQSLDLGAPFDVAFASGVLHHIPDQGVRSLVAGTMARLKPNGRFVAIDPTLIAGQGYISRTIVRGDRGEFVRSPEQLGALLANFDPAFEVVTDMLRIPYAQVITVIVKR